MTHAAVEMGLVLVVLLGLAMLAAGSLAMCIRLFAMQCLVLAAMPLAASGGPDAAHGAFGHALVILAGTILLKVWLIPWVLLRTIRTGEINREIEPLIGFASSVMIGALIVAGSFAMGSRLSIPGHPMSTLLVPVALATVLIGLLILVSRTKAITQVVGYLVMENGIFIFGLSLLHRMPLMVELGILLDVFVGVFVMAIVVWHIRRTFDHMDTLVLSEPRAD